MPDTILNGEFLEEVIVNGHKVFAEVAHRDDQGHIISKFYAPKISTQEKLVPGQNIITINNKSILTNSNINIYSKDETYSRAEITYYLQNKIELLYVNNLPSSNINTAAIYVNNLTKALYIFDGAAGKWIQIGIMMPSAPVAEGSYALTCNVDEFGYPMYRWGSVTVDENNGGSGNDNPGGNEGGNDNPTPTTDRLMSITMTALPAKVQYYIDEALVLTGMIVTARYRYAGNVVVTDAVTVETPNMSTAGTKVVDVIYTDSAGTTVTTSFNITVEEPVIEPDVPTPGENQEITDGMNSCIINFPFGESESTEITSISVEDISFDDNSDGTVDNLTMTGSKIYGFGSGGVRFNSSKAAGTLKVEFDELHVKTIRLFGSPYQTDVAKFTVTVNGSAITHDENIAADTPYIFGIDADITTFTISTSTVSGKGRAWLNKIIITTDDDLS